MDPTLRLVRRTAIASATAAALGIVFLVAMFTAFAVGAKAPGMVLGWINDVLVLVSYLLLMPSVIALRGLLRTSAPVASEAAVWIGIIAIAGIVILQALLVAGAMTFEEEVGPVSIFLIAIGAWFVLTGYLGRRGGLLPNGVAMGLLAASYVGFPIWAFWFARLLDGMIATRIASVPAV